MSHSWTMKQQLDTKELLLLESEIRNRGKDMLVAYLLWWFLGIFGAHRFYLGRTGSAILMLILTLTVIGLLITGIWWLIDAILTHKNVKQINQDLEDKLLLQLSLSR